MELHWANNGELQFRVHLKPNQELKYLNKGSTHTKACFKATPAGVFNRLAKLTTMTDENKDKTLKMLYPKHIGILEKAGLITEETPTLLQLHESMKTMATTTKSERDLQQKDRDRKRSTFFCVGHSNAWKIPIHQTIKRLKNSFGLTWIRTSMSHHRFTNLRELLNGDLTTKLNKEVISLDFQRLECNCRLKKGGTRECGYNNVCRRLVVVYKVRCTTTNKVHIGNTQQHFKTRMQQHFNDAKKLHGKGIKSDSCAKHFACQLQNFEDTSPKLQRSSIGCSVTWAGNPMGAVKSFGTQNCSLCNKERIEILKQSRLNPALLINSCSETCGACRHKPRFHGHPETSPSTDESQSEDEKDTRVSQCASAC